MQGVGTFKQLIILVDMDEVINNLTELWVKKLDEMHGLSVGYNDIKQWDLQISFPTLTKTEIYKPFHDKNLWKSMTPTLGSQETLKKWTENGHSVFITTTTFYKHAEPKAEWLLHHFPFLTWNNVIITSEKSLIKGDVLIDDGLHNLQKGDFAKVIMDRPWNHEFDEKTNGMYRIFNWQDADNLINKISKGEI